jgi:dTDP-glucose 4,6-dehydratase
VNFAAETHVDRSIRGAADFVVTNVLGAQALFDACLRHRVGRVVHVSTDEVYGAIPQGSWTEEHVLAPNSPYSAAKAGGDLLARAYAVTYGLDVSVTRCTNNYGPYQFPEKFIPLMISQALANQPLPVYGDGKNVRDWIHVADHCRAIDLILRKGKEGEIYNIGGGCELENITVARKILRALNRPESMLKFVTDRPAHDRRYALNCVKLKNELGWKPIWEFDRGLEETIRWYQGNSSWLEETRSGEYQNYFDRHYLRRAETFASPAKRSN